MNRTRVVLTTSRKGSLHDRITGRSQPGAPRTSSGSGLGDPRPRMCRAIHGHPRRVGRERRSAFDRARSSLFARRLAVGCQRLRAHVRRLPPFRWTGRRCLRAAPDIPDRALRLRRDQPHRRVRREFRVAHRRARRARDRRRRSLPHHLDDHCHHVLGTETGKGTRTMGCRRRSRWSNRSAARWDTHVGALVAMGALHQCADRHRDRASRHRLPG